MSLKEIELKKIRPNRLNPRLELNIEALNELADSVKQVGLVQPLVVRPVDGEYEVVVGERRYRACQQVGLDKIPAIIKEYSDDEVIELNLIENIQREDLNAVERGNCCKQLMERYPKKYPTVESIAKRIGVSRPTIQNWLPLTEAPEEMQRLVAPASVERRGVPEGKIDYTTATTILRQIQEPEKQVELARKIAQEKRVTQRVARKIIKEVSKEPEKPIEEVIKTIVEAPYELPFRLSHRDSILNGIKTQTSRKGLDPKIKKGAIVHASIWEPRFADLMIEKTERKRLGDFTEEDAKHEGGYNLEEFKDVWKELHGEWNPDERVYVVHFRKVS